MTFLAQVGCMLWAFLLMMALFVGTLSPVFYTVASGPTFILTVIILMLVGGTIWDMDYSLGRRLAFALLSITVVTWMYLISHHYSRPDISMVVIMIAVLLSAILTVSMVNKNMLLCIVLAGVTILLAYLATLNWRFIKQ